MTTLTCPCCGWTYEMQSGDWWQHQCSGRRRGPSHLWQEAWCHLEKPGATPRDGACGQCPVHCRCASRMKNNFPQMAPDESIQGFVHRLREAKREWSPHNSE